MPAGLLGIWSDWFEIFNLAESEMGRGKDGMTVTHIIEAEFNRRGDSAESTFDVEIVGLGQRVWLIGPGSTTIRFSYQLSSRAELHVKPLEGFSPALMARSRSHLFAQHIDARVTFR